ncbi:MAG: cadherin domain-containing protein [Chloroflexota bacterium]|nr:cadherin domain-containing protein [Lentimicrobium sp.]
MINKYTVLKKSILPTFAILIFWFYFVSSAIAQGTIYIDPSYTGSQQNGTQQYPFASWNSVSWTNGTTYLQKAGTTFNTPGSLIISSKNNITLGSYGTGNKPRIISSGATTSKVIDITSCYNMVISNLEIASTTGQVTAAIIIDGTGSSNNLIDNCIARDAQWGIRILTTSAGNRILNTQVYNTQDDGIYIKDTPDIEIGYCNVYNVNLKYFVNPDQTYSSGDNIQIASTNNHNFNIHHNILDHSTTGNKFCLIAWGNNYSGIVEYNTMIGNSSQVTSCIYLSPTTSNVTVRYNSISNGNYGIYSYVTNFHVYYNKFVSNKTAIAVLNNYHLLAENNIFYTNVNTAISGFSGSLVTSKNNIFYISGSSKAYSTSGSLTSDYNTFNTQYSGFINGYSTLAGWRSASGQDVHSMVANPMFVNPGAGNFTLQQTSPCINAGTICGYVHDFFGNPVPAGNSSDIGYYELPTNTNNPPVIQNQSFSIPENSSNSTVVGQVVASDPNSGQTITYQITSGNASGAFAINTTSGIITVNNSQVLNYETIPQFTLQVTVTDNLNASSAAIITINLSDVNEQPTSDDQGFNINENSGNGTLIGNIIAADPDQNQTLTYTITSGNNNQVFLLNSSTGALTVQNSQYLNFESTSIYTLGVRIQDNAATPLYDNISVTVSVQNINEPPLVSNQTFQINSTSPNGTLVGNINASDPDLNQVLTYINTSGNTNNAFSINSQSGNIYIANSSALVNLTVCTLGITVQDNGTPVLSSSCIVTVNIIATNLPPVVQNQQFIIAENASSGTVVGNISATDPNQGQILTYAIGSGNYLNAFALSPAGVLSVSNSSALNYEGVSTINLVITVSDNGVPVASSQATVTVSITDINESPFIAAGQNFTVIYNAPLGTAIGTVVASDPDNLQLLSYHIIDGNSTGAFAINPLTGLLTVANSNALRNLVNKTIKLRVQVIDNGTPALSYSEIINIRVVRRKETSIDSNVSIALKISSIYPNPSSNGQFNIVLSQNDESRLDISIFNLNGVKVYSDTVINNGTINLNLNGFKSGMYIINLHGDSVNEIKKLIIQ